MKERRNVSCVLRLETEQQNKTKNKNVISNFTFFAKTSLLRRIKNRFAFTSRQFLCDE